MQYKTNKDKVETYQVSKKLYHKSYYTYTCSSKNNHINLRVNLERRTDLLEICDYIGV